MPELPEAETIRRGLARRIIGKRIQKVAVVKKNLVKSPYEQFIRTLVGNAIVKLERRGKLLIARLKIGGFLLIHLKLTGQLIWRRKSAVVAGGHNLPDMRQERLPGKYTCIIFTFSDGSELFFNDMRQFGYMKIADKAGLEKILSDYGIEPLSPDFTLARFESIIKGRNAPIKAVLLNQKNIAGIGNIYADEICFASGVLPNRRANTLSLSEIKKLFQSCREILSLAVKMGGTTFRDYRDAAGGKGKFVKHLKVYGRAGEKCLRCGRVLKKSKLGGRGTVFCPHCQK